MANPPGDPAALLSGVIFHAHSYVWRSLFASVFAARRYARAAYAGMWCPSVRPSGCLSPSCILSKRINKSSFFRTKRYGIFRRWSPNGDVECRWRKQKSRFLTNIWLANDDCCSTTATATVQFTAQTATYQWSCLSQPAWTTIRRKENRTQFELYAAAEVNLQRNLRSTYYCTTEATDRHEALRGLSATSLLFVEHSSTATLLGQIAWAGWVSFDAKWTRYGISGQYYPASI